LISIRARVFLLFSIGVPRSGIASGGRIYPVVLFEFLRITRYVDAITGFQKGKESWLRSTDFYKISQIPLPWPRPVDGPVFNKVWTGIQVPPINTK
jgi:hypothetical protein